MNGHDVTAHAPKKPYGLSQKQMPKWASRNPEKIKEYNARRREKKAQWYRANAERMKAHRSTPEYRAKKNASRQERLRNDPEYREYISRQHHESHIRNYVQNPEKREQRKASQRAYHWRNQDQRNIAARVRRVGIKEAEYLVLLAAQNGVCAICKRDPEPQQRGNKIVTGLGIDHDHQTGKVRGILCHACNNALGMLQDDPAVVFNAWRYLSFHKERNNE